jgi:hypothetical protein
MRDSAIVRTPPARIARAISGSPQTHFVTAVTAMPWRRQRSTVARVFVAIFSRSATILIARGPSVDMQVPNDAHTLSKGCRATRGS